MANGTCTGEVSYGPRVRYARKFCHTQADQREGLKLRLGGWGPWTRDASDGERRVVNRLAAFDGAVRDPESALNRFGVRYLGLRASESPPSYLARQKWTRVQEGPFWQIWERSVSPR